MPVDNNEHQRIDDISTDRISYIYIYTLFPFLRFTLPDM